MCLPRLAEYLNSGCTDLLLDVINLFIDAIKGCISLSISGRFENFQKCLEKIMLNISTHDYDERKICLSDVPHYLEGMAEVIEVRVSTKSVCKLEANFSCY